jgi:hypothetical protein
MRITQDGNGGYNISCSGYELEQFNNGLYALIENGPDGLADEEEDIKQVKGWEKMEKQLSNAINKHYKWKKALFEWKELKKP